MSQNNFDMLSFSNLVNEMVSALSASNVGGSNGIDYRQIVIDSIGAINNTNSGTSSVNATPAVVTRVCPGLIRDPARRKWYIPEGYSSDDRTYCSACVEKYGIDTARCSMIQMEKCCCDSHIALSNMNNGIIYASIWSDDYKNFMIANENNVVEMKSGLFHIYLEYDATKFSSSKRAFRAKIYIDGREVWVSPITFKSVLAKDVGYFINSGSTIRSILPYHNKDLHVFTDSEIKISIEVFDIMHDYYENATNADLGELILMNNGKDICNKEKYANVYVHPHQTHVRHKASRVFKSRSKFDMVYNLKSVEVDKDPQFETLNEKLRTTIISRVKAEQVHVKSVFLEYMTKHADNNNILDRLKPKN